MRAAAAAPQGATPPDSGEEEVHVGPINDQVHGRKVSAAQPAATGRIDPADSPFELRVPVNVRSASLVILTVFASLFVLTWAKAVFVPLMLGMLFSYALSPIVNLAEKMYMPRWLGAAVLLIVVFAGLCFTAYSLKDQAVQLVESLPTAAQKFARSVRANNTSAPSPLDNVQKAAAQLEQAANGGTATVTNRGAMRVVVEPHAFNIKDYLWPGTLGLFAIIGQTTVVVFLTYFLMVSGDTFKRKLVKLAGPSLSSKKITVEVLYEITHQIQRYLQVQLMISALVGVITAATFFFLKVDNAVVWGVFAAILNMIPYVGSLITAGAAALVGFLQFGTLNMALAAGGTSLFIHTIIGNMLTPWLTGKAGHMNAVAVFVTLLAWGWLWGVWGLLMGVPIMMIVKSICDRVEELQPVSELLGS